MILEANRIEIRSRFKEHPDRVIIPCSSRKEAEKLKKQILYALKDYEIDYKGIVQKVRELVYHPSDYLLHTGHSTIYALDNITKELKEILGDKK